MPDGEGKRGFCAILSGELIPGAVDVQGSLSGRVCEAMKSLARVLEGGDMPWEKGGGSFPALGQRTEIIRSFSGFWNEMHRAARKADLCIRLRLSDESGEGISDVDAWPWELVFGPLMFPNIVSVVREVPGAYEGPPVIAFSRLKIRVCFSGAAGIAGHYENVVKTLDGIENVAVERYPAASAEDVLRGLDSPDGPHVLWIIGHGRPAVGAGHIEMRDGDLVDAALAEELRRDAEKGKKPATRVVILSSCSVAKVFGRTLQRAGVAAVLGFQGEVMADFSAGCLGAMIRDMAENPLTPLPVAVARRTRMVEQPHSFLPSGVRKKLKERMGVEEIGEVGRALAIAYISPRVSRIFSDLEACKVGEYVELLSNNVKWMTPIGARERARNYSSSAYVEPVLVESMEEGEDGGIGQGRTLDFSEFMSEITRKHGVKSVLLTGGPGAGKTELCRAVVRALTDGIKDSFEKDGKFGMAPIPVLIDATSGGRCPAGKSLRELVGFGLYVDWIDGLDGILRRYLEAGDIGLIVIGDALDENRHIGWILRDSIRYPGLERVMATCREGVVIPQSPEWEASYRIPDLSREEDIDRFVKGHWKPTDPSSEKVSRFVKRDSGMRKLCSCPLLFKLFLWVAEDEGHLHAMKNKASICERVIEKAIDRAWSEKGMSNVDEDIAKTAIFRVLDKSVSRVGELDNFIDTGSFLDAANEVLQEIRTRIVIDDIKGIAVRSGLFVKARRGSISGFELFNRYIFEYIVARSIVNAGRPATWKKLLDHAYDADWEEVMILAVYKTVEDGKVPDIILKSLAGKTEDCAGHLSKLLCRCVSVAWDVVPKTYKEKCLQYFNHELPMIREGAVHGIEEAIELASHEEVLDAITTALADEDVHVRVRAAEVLSSQAHARRVREALLGKLGREEPGIRLSAAAALSSQAHEPEVRRALLERLEDREGAVRSAAVRVLSSQAHFPDVLRALLGRLDDEHGVVRSAAARTLSSQVHRQQVLYALLEKLADNDKYVRSSAARALSSHAHVPGVRDALLERLGGEAWYVRSSAARALSLQLHDSEVRDVLMERLVDSNWYVRSSSARDMSSQAHVPAIRSILLERLGDKYWNVRTSAIDALSSQAHLVEVRDALLERLGDEEWYVQSAAARALSSQAHLAEVRGPLLGTIRDKEWSVRSSAAKALSSQAHLIEVRDAFFERLGDENRKVRLRAVKALMSVSESSEGVLQKIIELAGTDEIVKEIIAGKGPVLPLVSGEFVWRKTGKKI